MTEQLRPMSRRGFVFGTAAIAGLAACGSSSKKGSSTSSGDASDSGANGNYELVARFSSDSLVAGIAQRMVFSLANQDGSGVSKGPDQFEIQVKTLEGVSVGSPIVVKRRQNTGTSPFWVMTTTFDKPGTWVVTATFPDKSNASKAIAVLDRATNQMPTIGDRMVSVATPTTADAHGVNPICTRTPPCPLHEISLDDALKNGKPTVLLIGTPAYCQTGVCGPVLDLLVTAQKSFAGNIIHGEVYKSAYTGPETLTTDVVDAFRLSFEPYLVLADATGTITSRLDVLWDASELQAVLASVS